MVERVTACSNIQAASERLGKTGGTRSCQMRPEDIPIDVHVTYTGWDVAGAESLVSDGLGQSPRELDAQLLLRLLDHQILRPVPFADRRRIAAEPISPGVFAAAVCPFNRIVRSEPWKFTLGESPQRNRYGLLATPGPSRLPQLFRQPATPPCRSAPDHPLGVRPDCGGASAPAPPP